MLKVTTLGNAAIHLPTGEVDLRSKKQLALLIYLAVNQGKKIRRATIAELLWPDSDNGHGGHSVSQAAYNLRLTVPTLCLELHRDSLRIPNNTVTIDLLDIRYAIADGDLR